MAAVSTGVQSGLLEWKNGPQPPEWTSRQARYQERYLLAKGELFLYGWRTNPYKDDPRVYKNISLLWDCVSRVNDFYTSTVYQGELIARPNEGAIPIQPDPSLSTAQIDNLMAAHRALWLKWNWQEQKGDRVEMAVSVGDCMTELEDNLDKRFPQPKIIWPGYVKNLELDQPGNIEWYELEYQVQDRKPDGTLDTPYLYRKEVDGEAFRYFRDDKPWSDPDGHGDAVQPNPYGFVPAIWDRHKRRAGIDNYGNSATDESRQTLFGLNSLFSHARDFQHKAFYAPVVVAGKISQKDQKSIDLSGPAGDPSAMAQSLSFLEGSPDATIHQAQFDIGQTMLALEMMKSSILGKHPEATIFDNLADAAQVTGPGADRIIIPVKGRRENACSGYDSRTIHLQQMAITMAAIRIKAGDYGSVSKLDDLRRAFLPYDAESYDRGELRYTIDLNRPIVVPSKSERIEEVAATEKLETLWALRQVDVSEEDAQEIIKGRREMDTLIGDFTPVDEGREDVT